jgi:predicted deacylase
MHEQCCCQRCRAGTPFDEACASPWWVLAANHPGLPIPAACLAATLELGSNDDVNPERAADQATALLRMLQGRGFVEGSGGRPRLSCRATALTAMAQLRSPVTGLVQPYAWPGRVIGKIAGEIPLDGRTGNLLSD